MKFHNGHCRSSFTICCAHVRIFRPSDYFGERPPEIGTPPDPLPSTEPVERYSQDNDVAAERGPLLFALLKALILGQ